MFGSVGVHFGDKRRETGVFALREGGFDAAARIVEDLYARIAAVHPLRRLAEVELDDFAGARTDEKQQLDLGAAGQQLPDDLVEFVIGIGKAGEIAFLDDRRAEARLGKDHDTRGGLQQVRAGAAADDKEKRILDLAMQPDDAGEAAKHLALAAFAKHGHFGAGGRSECRRHAATAADVSARGAGASSRAILSFQMNWAALMT